MFERIIGMSPRVGSALRDRVDLPVHAVGNAPIERALQRQPATGSIENQQSFEPDGELDGFVDALATRIASFDRWAIANTKRLVNAASLPPDVEIAAGWDACMTSITRPASQERIKALLERGFHKPGDVENRLGHFVGQLGAWLGQSAPGYDQDA
jgi:hypothetical protein